MGVKYDFDMALMQGSTNVRTKVDIFKLIVATRWLKDADTSTGELANAAQKRILTKSVHVLCPLLVRWDAAGIDEKYATYMEWLLLRLGKDYYIVEMHTDKKNSGELISQVTRVLKNPPLWTDLGHTTAKTVADLALDTLGDLHSKLYGGGSSELPTRPDPVPASTSSSAPDDAYANAQNPGDDDGGVPPGGGDDVRTTSVTRYPNTTGRTIDLTAGGARYRATI